jgi:hypothetical protein
LQPNSDEIRGVAILLGETPDLVQVAVRLPPAMAMLAPDIIQQIEHDHQR